MAQESLASIRHRLTTLTTMGAWAARVDPGAAMHEALNVAEELLRRVDHLKKITEEGQAATCKTITALEVERDRYKNLCETSQLWNENERLRDMIKGSIDNPPWISFEGRRVPVNSVEMREVIDIARERAAELEVAYEEINKLEADRASFKDFEKNMLDELPELVERIANLVKERDELSAALHQAGDVRVELVQRIANLVKERDELKDVRDRLLREEASEKTAIGSRALWPNPAEREHFIAMLHTAHDLAEYEYMGVVSGAMTRLIGLLENYDFTRRPRAPKVEPPEGIR